MIRPFSTICVIGLGTTGSALAALLAAHGYRVDGVECDAHSLLRGRSAVAAAIDALGLPDAAEVEALRRVNLTTSTSLFSRADLVIEAVPEQLPQKVEVLRQADSLCPAATVFATTTTALPVTEIASRSGRMTRTVGLHLCHPGQLSDGSVVEVVLPPVTDHRVRSEIDNLVRSLGKSPVAVADHPGLLGAGLYLGYLNSAAAMYAQAYASRDDIDAALIHGCGLRVGPLTQLDVMGLDVVLDSLRVLAERTGDEWYAPAGILSRMVDAGLLGRKSGRGFYQYDNDEDPPREPDDGATARQVTKVGVVGAGTMAAGIAEVFARAGYPTAVAARTDERATTTLSTVEKSLSRAVHRGKLVGEDMDRAMARLSGAGELGALHDCDLVIEAVTEELTVKRSVFAELDKLTRSGTVLATTTSSLPVLQIATATARPEDVVAMHFFNPAPVMKLVEVAHTPLTSDDVVATALAVTRSLGRCPVRCGDRTGFIVNALLFPYLNRAVNLAQRLHVGLDVVDSVMTGAYGHPVGPFQLLDMVGLDVSLAIQERLHETCHDPGLAPAEYLSDFVAAGYLGRKSGRGFRVHQPA
ncbi:3-hydroxyacyl-CoA dehydrogenase family protein [Goodfellowiella coeruleoviolacea]|uniref:3-hydroxybutyryl-CoA dehydrogenase n=1 Tax=Goodfellowiella coeruleoviolacea TaxID=334858 RepID=A0AAE3GMF8_9PSEU|nr:3-hydroxyacyl-CoA dehydrogenase NAD-binding domain-containing protein [Goodfellowiella coeruleoviolacea]MCP2170280.1 3-hydroxybutyryl-CoA dehydrogenase [Goodfellowiella coeruleoviolacea]